MNRCPRPSRRLAFTLIEVLVVVTIVGIIGAMVVPQLLSAGTLGLQGAARLVVADILFAQNEAIAAQESRKVIFDAANESYRLTRDVGGTDETLTMGWVNGDTNNYVVDFTADDRFNGIEIVSVQMGGVDVTEIEFDDLGAPQQASEIQVLLRMQNQTLTVRVAPFTGRVTVD